MTHVGPDISSTTKRYDSMNLINSGSPTLSKFIIESDFNILANIHGHSHEC